MANMTPLSVMNQNYQRYQQGAKLPPAVPFYAKGEDPNLPMGMAGYGANDPVDLNVYPDNYFDNAPVSGYDAAGNPDPSQFIPAKPSAQSQPVMHNSLSELALAQNPNLSAAQMQQINADWNRPELFEGEHAQRAEFERQLAGEGPGVYPGPKGSLATRGRGAGTLNAMQPLGQGPGLEIAGAYQNPETIQPLEMEQAKIEKEIEKFASKRERERSSQDFMQKIYAMGQQLQSNSGPMAAFGQMAQGAKGGYTPYTAQKR